MIPLAFVLLLSWSLLYLVLFRIPLCHSRNGDPSRPRLSIIIPARDEEQNLPTLLDSLAAQDPPPDEIIVVDDDSSDNTAAVARERGATVLPSRPLPDGWRGKTWACSQGAEKATGDVLLFVDADTFFEPGGLRRIADTFQERPGVLSIGAYHRVRRPYENLSAYFNLLMTAGTGAFTAFSRGRSPDGLFGPFLMVRRDLYEAVDGHERVRGRVLENYHLAREFRKLDAPMRCYGGKGSFSMRMYPHGLGDLINGWSKAFASGAAETPRWILLLTVAWITGALGTLFYGLWAVLDPHPLDLALAGGLYLLFAVQLAVVLRRLGSFSLLAALLYPVPLFFYLVVFTRSSVFLRRKKVSWKGRDFEGAG